MKHIKAFVAGIIIPAILLPVLRHIFFLQGHTGAGARPLQYFALSIPLAWGVWNVIFFLLENQRPLQGRDTRRWLFGAGLGFIMALISVFIVGVPGKVLGVTGALQYLPLLVIPLIYSFVWRYLVKLFNVIVGAE